jgi:hypothetical protein
LWSGMVPLTDETEDCTAGGADGTQRSAFSPRQ